MGDEDDGRWVSGKNHSLRRALHFASSYVETFVDCEKNRWQGAPMGTVAMRFPFTVLFNLAHSTASGHVWSPGIVRHPPDGSESCLDCITWPFTAIDEIKR